MGESLFKMFGTVRLVQEVSRSASQSPSTPAISAPSDSPQPIPPPLHTPTLTVTATATTSVPENEESAAPSSNSNIPQMPLPPPHYSAATLYLPQTWLVTLPSPLPPASARPRRKHSRRNSFFRHHRPKQPSIIKKGKPKTQKLLCLWPLPLITRYIICISTIVSALNFMGMTHLKCSSPSFVIHRQEIVNLLLSPFLFTGSWHTFFLFAWNVLILGLFEESLTHMLGGTRRFLRVFVGIVLSVCLIRQGIGYLFSKSTGFAVPTLFFSDSLHECSQGKTKN